ncbi:MAG TPA: energy transducer TonB [Pyrinomonadaceae bacterium]|nr:energy transducer TonB [Pyrinomonadaceae bacterium]
MKRCNACEEEFADKFSFCPVDGSALNKVAAAVVGKVLVEKELPKKEMSADQSSRAGRPCHTPCHTPRHDFNLTLINSATLTHRLAREIAFAAGQLRLLWPEFKKEPVSVTRREINSLRLWFSALARPNVLAGVTTAILVVLFASLSLIFFGKGKSQQYSEAGEELELVEVMTIIPGETPPPEGSGAGATSNGRVGFNKGQGEGSDQQRKASRGGGGSGNHDLTPASVGKIQVPAAVPAPISKPLPNPALPAAGIDLDPALWRNLPFVAYGDPRSTSIAPSKGPGNGGAIGSGDGLGNGPGKGNGVGPGEDGNIGGGKKEIGGPGPGGARGNYPAEPNRIFRTSDVTQRARVIAKPEPQYTETARKNSITGSVVLSAVFSESGEVTNIRAIKSLPDGLTEKAIAAARLIRFIPASRNGQPVSVYMQLEYNFNLY